MQDISEKEGEEGVQKYEEEEEDKRRRYQTTVRVIDWKRKNGQVAGGGRLFNGPQVGRHWVMLMVSSRGPLVAHVDPASLMSFHMWEI